MFHDTSAMIFWHKFAQVIPYGIFAISFTLVTAWMYIRLGKRRLDRAARDSGSELDQRRILD